MTKRVPIRALLIAAIITALIAGTALAARYVFSAMNARVALPEAAEALVDVGMASFESQLIRYQPIDALVDGDNLIITVEVQPIDPEKYLIADSWGGRDSAIVAEGMTWPAYAVAQGKTLVKVELGVRVNGKIAIDGYSEEIEGDKMLVLMNCTIPFERDDPTEPLEIELTGYDQEVYASRQVEEEGYINTVEDAGEQHKTVSRLTIQPKLLRSEHLRFEGPFEREYVTIEAVEFDSSAASLGMKIWYTLHDDLPAEIRDAMPEVRFVLSDPTGQHDFRSNDYGALDTISYPVTGDKYGDFGSPEPPPTNTYIEEMVWPAIEHWPETFELNVLYKGTGEWDAPVSLKRSESMP